MKRFAALFATNFCGVANDNFLKTLASFTLLGWVADTRTRAVLMGITAASLVLPYILVSPLADRLTALFAKVRIIRIAKFCELPIIALAITGLVLHSAALVIAAIVLMGLQSALFSPAKYALIRDIGGEDRIASGMGLMEGVSFLAVLGGTVAASFLADRAPREGYLVLALLAALGLVLSFGLRARETLNRELHAVNPVRFFRRARRMTRRYPGLDAVIAALCLFWATAAMLQQGLIVYGTAVLGLDATHTGMLLVLAALGIVSGQVLAGFLDRNGRLLPYVPLFGFLASLLLLALFATPAIPHFHNSTLSQYHITTLLLALLAFDLGFFKLPLDAAIQRQVKGARLNTILAYFNQITFLYMFGASIVYSALGWCLGPGAFLALLAGVMAAASFIFLLSNRPALVLIGTFFLKARYNIKADPIPQYHNSTVLLLPNHPALIDPFLVLATYADAHLNPLVDGAFFAVPAFARVLEAVGSVRVPDLRGRHTRADIAAAQGLRGAVLEALGKGTNVLLYPSGHIYTRNEEEIGTRQLAYTVCRDLPEGVTVVGLRTSGLWGSSWSRRGRRTSPNFALTLLRNLLLWPFSFIRPKRRVTMHTEDLTDRVREWSRLPRREFNAHLTDWYNAR